jgi:hypothetical protein
VNALRARVLLVVALLALGLTAVSSAAPLVPFRVPTGGFSIALPANWVEVTSAAPAMLAKLEQVPALRAFARSAGQSGSLKLIAADPTSKQGAYMDTGVARIGAASLPAIANATAKALRQSLGKTGSVTVAKLQIPAGTVYLLHLSKKGAPNRTDEYMFLRGQVEYVLVYVAPSQLWSRYEPVFTASAKSFRFLPAPDLSHVVLSGAQVGTGYKLQTFPFGNSFIGEPTLDLCAGSYASETLRTGRLQVRYTHAGMAPSVSNEVVTYASGGAQQALQEVGNVARSCARRPVVLKSGAASETFRVTPITDPRLPAGSIAVKLNITSVNGKKRVDQTGIAIYQVKGNTLSGVYTFVSKGTTFAEAQRVAFHAAEQSAHNLGSNSLTA